MNFKNFFNQFYEANTIACIGTGHTNKEQEQLCRLIGRLIVETNRELNSGNCIGADQAYAIGANSINPKLVNLYLVNEKHNKYAIENGNKIIYNDDHPEWIEIARRNHSGYDYQSEYIKKLFNRNVGIVINSQLVIALPNVNKAHGDGTGHGIKIAKEFNIPIWDIARSRDDIINVNKFLTSYFKVTHKYGKKA